MVDQYRIVSLVFGVVIQPCVGKGRTTSRCPWAPRTTDGIRGGPTLKNKVLLPVFFSHIPERIIGSGGQIRRIQ
jgi:hypothetical protein